MLNVVIATPLGEGGKGGIDRIMDEVRAELAMGAEPGLKARFIVTRGQRNAAFSAVQLPIAMAQLVALRLQGRADVVHINLSSHGSMIRKMMLASLCRALGAPYILHVHGSRTRQYWQGVKPAVRKRIDAMFVGAGRILVLGDIWRRFVTEQEPAAAPRITILPNATRAATLPHVPGDKVRILFLGRVGERKGVPELIEALGALPRAGNWQAIIAGDGELDQSQARITELGLQDKVTMPGWVGPDDVAQLLAASDILTLPSYDENLPMSVIEAMANGLAVVATPVGATEEIIVDGQTGLLVQPGDAPGLATALGRLLDDPSLRERLGQAARTTHAERLEIRPYAARLQQIWREVAQATKSLSGE